MWVEFRQLPRGPLAVGIHESSPDDTRRARLCHEMISWTTRAGMTPVSFWSSPWCLNVKRS